mgnify:CR=1 FL=1
MKIAIRGHKSRGEEVIKILEMLGGKQGYEICTGSDTGYYWYIKDNGLITCNYSAYKNDCVEYTLEEFLYISVRNYSHIEFVLSGAKLRIYFYIYKRWGFVFLCG